MQHINFSASLLFVMLFCGHFNSIAQVPKKLLVEEFTQASCVPCAQLNPAFNALLDANAQNVIPLKYQTSWPGIDPMNEQNPIEVRSRVDYYGVSGVPTAIMNGGNLESPANINQIKIDEQTQLSSPIAILLNHNISSDFATINIECNVQNKGLVSIGSANMVLHVVLVEQTINFPSPPGSNGELDFSYVMRKMIPNEYGSPVTELIPAGASKQFNFSIPTPAYLYDLRNLGVIAFIQYSDTKQIEQSSYSPPVQLNITEFYDLRMSSSTTFPSGYCNYELKPAVNVENVGNRTISSIKAAYRYNNEALSSTLWTGILLPGESTIVNFPTKIVGAGKNEIAYFLQQINNSLDSNNFNNNPKKESFLTYEELSFDIGFEENFEQVETSGNPPHTIQIERTANRIEVVSKEYFKNSTRVIPRMGAYEQSDKSVWIFMWNMLFGEQASLMYEKLDLSKRNRNTLQFDYAYCQSLGVENDRLDIQVSTDCGKTWKNVWSKFGKNLATTAPQKDNFFPFLPISTDWKHEVVDLSSVDGIDGVNIRFQGTSNYGNNVYLDNIKVSGEATAVYEPIQEFEISVYSNPGRVGTPIKILSKNKPIENLNIFDAQGKQMYASKKSQIVHWIPEHSGMYTMIAKTETAHIVKKIFVF